eukprot:TRINITY_DN7368_c0_g1_i2.p2 TRINITY_DN7368_c0_g1~~TRINITY_DN7368_c0_g1_i2.p2  ORF type:complete len:249 (-),score=68.74 TRINITY_DN7368_c0_g1_i2:140-886(-)
MSSMTNFLGGESSHDEKEDVHKNLLAYGSDEGVQGEKKKDKKKKKKDKKDKKKKKDRDRDDDDDEGERVTESESDASTKQMSVFTPDNSASSLEEFIPSQNNINLQQKGGGKKKKEKEFGLPDAKSLLSNERNFLSWIGTSFSLGAIGTAIITFFGTDVVSLISGVFLWTIAIGFILYSTMQFRRRADAIRTRTRGPFDDQRGPLALVVLSTVAVGIFLLFFIIVRPAANVSFGGGNATSGGSSSTTT